jgi:TPR repeat protein
VNRFLSAVLLVSMASLSISAGQPLESERKQLQALKAKAGSGDAQAQLDLGMCYWTGTWVARDLRQAAKWHRKAAEQGLARAEYQLGLDLAAGDGVEMNKREAVAWFRRAADQNLLEAQYTLGLCYENGKGVNPNEVEAVKWFRKAADGGYLDAQAELGNCYMEGTGVAKDPPEGVKWIRRAADSGCVSAQMSLATCYQKGSGVPKDPVQAYKWFALAASQDDERGADLRVDLAKLESVLTPEQVAEAQRLAHEFKPASAGVPAPLDTGNGKSEATLASGTLADTAKTGMVNVTSEDEHCDVFVDGAFVGNSPAKLKLVDGSHVVEVRKPGFKTYRRELQVGAGSELSVRAALEKE